MTQHLIFPGGGVFFWWQAGTIQALKEAMDLKNGDFCMSGASAGSISSVMAACGTDLHAAMRAALHLPKKSKVYSHAFLIEKWLHEILPANCHELCSGKVFISITTIHLSFVPLHRKSVSRFSSKQDLIDACLTSSFIPFVLDGHISRKFHGESCVDGSFLFFLKNVPWDKAELLDDHPRIMMMDHHKDAILMKKHFNILSVLTEESTQEMFDMGYNYGKEFLKTGMAIENALHPETIHKIVTHRNIYSKK